MAKEVAISLAQRSEDVASYLLPQGKREGNEWCVGSINGEPGNSLKVHLSGKKAGVWCDFATGGNDTGDLLDLWAKTRNLKLLAAMQEAANYLGISIPHFDAYKIPNFVKPPQNTPRLTQESAVMRYLVQERKLLPATLTAYRIGEHANEIVFPYWRDNHIIFTKYLKLDRPNGKKQIRVESNCEPCLFGWHMLPDSARTIIICEGEIDAMTLYQYGLPALSVPFGAGGGNKHAWIAHEFERLAMFDEIFLCMDNDEEGQIATNELIERLGRHRCRVIVLPCNDANQCLQAGMTADTIKQCVAAAKSLDPEELKPAQHFVDQVIDIFHPKPDLFLGYRTPWDKTHGKILFRPEELSVWTGINGHGKSQFLGHITLAMMEQGARVCIASLELKPKRLLQRLTRQAGTIDVPSPEYIRVIHQWYEDKLWLFDLVGTAKAKRLLEVFLYARQRYGIDVFIIDSFMKLDIAEDDYKAQKALVEQLCDFKNQHNCQIHIVVHPRKGADESQPPSKLDIKGTGAISDLADNCFSVWRNKEKESLLRDQASGTVLTEKEIDKLKCSDCIWYCDKQRNSDGDGEGRFGFWFDHRSLQYLSAAHHKPKQLVHYSRFEQAN